MTSLEQQAEAIIAQGSKSFAAAAKLFDAQTRKSAIFLYAWCRYCDDVIDGQVLGFGQSHSAIPVTDRLHLLYDQTRDALSGKQVIDPAFQGLQQVFHTHHIPAQLAYDHLEGFAMDVAGRSYDTIEDTLQYCYHVAGVVGLMMARIMGASEQGVLDRACDLGIAFQLTNIARDIMEDAQNKRIYIPHQWLEASGISPHELMNPSHKPQLAALAKRLVTLAEPYYQSSLMGISALPFRSAWSIAAARRVYRGIGLEVIDKGVDALEKRVSTNTAQKMVFVSQAFYDAVRSRVNIRQKLLVPRRGLLSFSNNSAC